MPSEKPAGVGIGCDERILSPDRAACAASGFPAAECFEVMV